MFNYWNSCQTLLYSLLCCWRSVLEYIISPILFVSPGVRWWFWYQCNLKILKSPVRKVSQTGHTKTLSTWCVFRCIVALDVFKKFLPQKKQPYARWPVWMPMWLRSPEFLTNALSQWGHANFRFWMCDNRWSFNLYFWINVLGHISQANFFVFEWISIWLCMVDFCRKA